MFDTVSGTAYTEPIETQNTKRKEGIMKTITTKKLALVNVPTGEYEDIVAFQLVEFTINFFGNIMTEVFDTKILKNGEQLVIDGNGFIETGYKVV